MIGSEHGRFAYQYTANVNGRSRVQRLECPTCGRVWDVRNRGRETGFIVAAANAHATKCAREQDKHVETLKERL